MGMWHAWEKTEIHIAFWSENLKDTDHLKKLSVDGKIVLKSILNKTAGWVGVEDWADSAQGSYPRGRGATR